MRQLGPVAGGVASPPCDAIDELLRHFRRHGAAGCAAVPHDQVRGMAKRGVGSDARVAVRPAAFERNFQARQRLPRPPRGIHARQQLADHAAGGGRGGKRAGRTGSRLSPSSRPTTCTPRWRSNSSSAASMSSATSRLDWHQENPNYLYLTPLGQAPYRIGCGGAGDAGPAGTSRGLSGRICQHLRRGGAGDHRAARRSGA